MMAASQADIGLTGLALSGILVAVAVAISIVQRLGLTRDLLVAAARALVQLLIVGAALALVIDDSNPLIWTWLWLAVMVAFASWTVGRRAPEVPGARVLALGAFTAAGTARGWRSLIGNLRFVLLGRFSRILQYTRCARLEFQP